MTKDKDSRSEVPQRNSPASAPAGASAGASDVARKSGGDLAGRSSASAIADFIKSAKTTNTASAGRLVFAMDATMSRQPSWDRAMTLQASMFDAVDEAGKSRGDGAGLSVQLVYFRGFGECRASRFVVNAKALRDLMTGIECRGGQTQIGKVLSHVNKENSKAKVDALVFIGDAMEEDIDQLCDKAGQLGLKGTRCFFFQEGSDPVTERAYREMARLTRGAYFRLGPDSSRELADLLAAVASYARGGLKALQSSRRRADRLLLERLESRS